jgi:hypothetical protein
VRLLVPELPVGPEPVGLAEPVELESLLGELEWVTAHPQ